MNENSHIQEQQSRLGGSWVVVIMFAFASLVTATLWFYWEFHTRPFREFQQALNSAYPGSSPRVEGGQHKSHLETPRILRVVMRVNYHPCQESDAFLDQINQIHQIASGSVKIEEYELLEVHLFWKREEQSPIVRSFQGKMEAWPLTKEFLPECKSLTSRVLTE